MSQQPGGNPKTLSTQGGQGRPRADASTEFNRPLSVAVPALVPRMGHTDPSNNAMAAPVGRDKGAVRPTNPLQRPLPGQEHSALSPSSTGSRKEPERIMPLDLSARERVLPIWEVLYSSKVESWVGMLLERVIRGAVVAVGLTARRKQGGGRVRVTLGTWHQDGEAGLGAIHKSCDAVRKQGLGSQSREGPLKAKGMLMLGRPGHQHQGNHKAEKQIHCPRTKWVPLCHSPTPVGVGVEPVVPTCLPGPSKPSRNMQVLVRSGQGLFLALPGTPRGAVMA